MATEFPGGEARDEPDSSKFTLPRKLPEEVKAESLALTRDTRKRLGMTDLTHEQRDEREALLREYREGTSPEDRRSAARRLLALDRPGWSSNVTERRSAAAQEEARSE
jgi:hypothetical protein